eukprot:4046377-Pyramimonas_sp.AAC.1
MVRELGYDSAAMRAVVALVAVLAAGLPAIAFGCAPPSREATCERLLIEKADAALLARGIHRLPQFGNVDSSAIMHCDSGVNLGCNSYDANRNARGHDLIRTR